jgi:phage FluMu protein Com
MNQAYHIRRSNMLKALGLGTKIPVGFAQCYRNVEVVTGPFHYDESQPLTPIQTSWKKIILPYVQVVEKGVANRIQVECPKCKTMMRFCALQQHVDTETCKAANTDVVSWCPCLLRWLHVLPDRQRLTHYLSPRR